MAKELLCGTFCLGLVILSLFLFVSLDSLQYNQVGLNYSNYFKSVEDSTYEAGYHFIGLGHDFIPYDLKISTMEFGDDKKTRDLPKISCRTKDGLKLDLEVSFQYRVMKEHIYKIYTKYGDEMKKILLRMAVDSISDTSTLYTSYDFFTFRELISAKMKDDLNQRLTTDLYSEVVFF